MPAYAERALCLRSDTIARRYASGFEIIASRLRLAPSTAILAGRQTQLNRRGLQDDCAQHGSMKGT
jgi:hypothetical protein